MEKKFIRVRSVKDIIVFVLLAVVGCVLAILPLGKSVVFLGATLAIIGIVLAVTIKRVYKDVETGETYLMKQLSFHQNMCKSIASVIETAPEKIDLTDEGKSNAVKLDIYYSKSLGKAYLQLFEYVPYHYEPRSSMIEHELSRVASLVK